MPELPEVNALVEFLDKETTGAVVVGVELASFAVLKTFDPPVSALSGLAVSGVSRHGKFIDIDVDGIHIVVHLAKAGWLRWSHQLPDTKLKLGASNIAARVRLDNGDGPHHRLRCHRGGDPQGPRDVCGPRSVRGARHRRPRP